MTILEKIANWACSLRHEQIPHATLERAKLQTESMALAAEAGASSEGYKKIERAVSWKGAEPSFTAYLNAAASIAHDWDDYLFMGHTGHSSVWSSRVVGAKAKASEDEVLTAQIIANEIEGRLGLALALGPHNGQLWASIHCAGAAAASAKVLGLNVDQTAHACAIALYQPPYGLWPGFMGPESKLLTAAEPTASGIRAASMAAQGLTGPLDVIEAERGMLVHFSFHPKPGMIDCFGDIWLTDTLAIKPYPGCAYLQTAVEAALQARASESFSVDEIDSVEVAAGIMTCGMEGLSQAGKITPVHVNFSACLSVAVALIAGRLTHRELDPGWLASHIGQIEQLATKTKLKHDAGMTKKTLDGLAVAGGLDLIVRGVPLASWLKIRRRMKEIGMTDFEVGLAGVRSTLGKLFVSWLRQRGKPSSLNELDCPNLSMSFPAKVTVRLRSGRTHEAAAEGRGCCGSSLEEAGNVVASKRDAVRSGG